MLQICSILFGIVAVRTALRRAGILTPGFGGIYVKWAILDSNQ